MTPRILRRSLGVWILSSALLAGVALAERAPDRAVEVRTQAPSLVVPRPVVTLPSLPPPAPSTTTTAAPPPPPTLAPVLAPTTTTAPAPVEVVPEPVSVPTDPAPAPPPTAAPIEYALGVLRSVIPGRWLAVVPVQISVIPGQTSWSSYGGLIELGEWHLFHSADRARFVLAHEWGHQAAWVFGPDTYDGEPPTGFPYGGSQPEEQWADCVGEVLTGASYPSAGLSGCPDVARSFTARWIAAGPPR